MAKRHFPDLDKSLIRFTTDALPFLEEAAVISPESWADVLPLIQGATLVLEKPKYSTHKPCQTRLVEPSPMCGVNASESGDMLITNSRAGASGPAYSSQSSRDIILVLSTIGEVLYCDAAAELLGWKEEEVVNTELASWMHGTACCPFSPVTVN